MVHHFLWSGVALGGPMALGDQYFDVSRSANLHDVTRQSNCFYIPSATAEPLMYEGRVVGDILQGNAVNCELIAICPHGSCTHTECVGHITPEKVPVECPPPLMSSVLVSVETMALGDSEDSYPAAHNQDDQ